MNLLILGGSVFLGRHITTCARDAGHAVTHFNRGRSNPDLPADVQHIAGDRDGGLAGLAEHHWDAVIDTSGYVPRIVRDSAEVLADLTDHYTFISTISVYAAFHELGDTEDSAVGQLEDETVEQVNGDSYGPLKALCERAVVDSFPDRSLIVRPGIIVGPHDPTDRFTYWPNRITEGGDVLVLVVPISVYS